MKEGYEPVFLPIRRGSKGQGLDEHAPIIALVAVVFVAAMPWVARCMEQADERVGVQQVGSGTFHAAVYFADGSAPFMLAVSMLLETGPRLTCRVGPIYP